MEEKLTKQLNIAIGIVFVIAALVLVYSAAHRQSQDQGAIGSATDTGQTAAPAPTVEYDQLAGMKKLTLAADLESWTPDAKIDAAKTVSKIIALSGQVDKAYLAVKASESGNALTKYQSVYFKLNDLGGHLFRPDTLAVPPASGTSLLFDMKNTPYLPNLPYSDDRLPGHADFIALMGPKSHLLVTSFVSSLQPASLDDLTIYYRCAKDSDCSISLGQ